MLYIFIYILLIIWGISFAILYTQYQILVFVGILLLFPLITYVISIIAGIFLNVSVIEEGRKKFGEKEKVFRITLTNKTIFPILKGMLYYQYGYSVLNKGVKGKLSIRIAGRSTKEYKLKVNGEYYGEIYFKIRSIRIRDYVGFLSFYLRKRASVRQSVLPKLSPVMINIEESTGIVEAENYEFSQDHPGNDPSEVYDIRDYKEGDRFERIHWKLSSKKDKLMVKEFSDPIVVDTSIIFDNFVDKLCGDELLKEWSKRLESVMCTSYSLLLREIFHFVYWYDTEKKIFVKKEVRDYVDFNICFRELFHSKGYVDCKEFVQVLRLEQELENFKNILYVGSNHLSFLEMGIPVRVVE